MHVCAGGCQSGMGFFAVYISIGVFIVYSLFLPNISKYHFKVTIKRVADTMEWCMTSEKRLGVFIVLKLSWTLIYFIIYNSLKCVLKVFSDRYFQSSIYFSYGYYEKLT